MRDPLERTEDELRALLERATPTPGAPGDRLSAVRGRIRRRRRRTMAGAVLASALAVTGIVGPQFLKETAGAPAAPAALPPDPPAPSAPDAGADAYQKFRFPDLEGVTVEAPASWSVIAMPPAPGVPARGFLGTQKFTSLTRPCGADWIGDCLPSKRLGPGDVLIDMFDNTTVNPGKEEDRSVLSRHDDMKGTRCGDLGAVASYSAEVIDEKRYHDLKTIFTVCVGPDTPQKTLDAVQRVVDSTHFRNKKPPVAPSGEQKKSGGR